MGLFQAFDKLDDIVYRPIDTFCRRIEEPMKRRKQEREEKKKEDAHDRSEKSKARAHKREKEKEKLDAELKESLQKANAEMEELKKDGELRRKKEAAEAMVAYQKKLMQLNNEAIEALGNMRLDLQERALDLIEKRKERYRRQRDSARKDAMENLKQIKEEFDEDDFVRERLADLVMTDLENILNESSQFIDDLRSILHGLNADIKLLTEQGQDLVDRQADRLGIIEEHVSPDQLESDHQRLPPSQTED